MLLLAAVGRMAAVCMHVVCGDSYKQLTVANIEREETKFADDARLVHTLSKQHSSRNMTTCSHHHEI
jgi:hypothetical protein